MSTDVAGAAAAKIEAPRPPSNLPDMRGLLAWPTGMRFPPTDDFNRILGCLFREVGRVSGDLQFFEAVEDVRPRGGERIAALTTEKVNPFGIPIDFGSLRNGHTPTTPIPPSWIVVARVPLHYGEPPEAMVLTLGTDAPQLLNRGQYLNFMASCGVDAHRATKVLFGTWQTALTVTEHRVLAQEPKRRLEDIEAQIQKIFADHALTW